jgi:hypothetical protein
MPSKKAKAAKRVKVAKKSTKAPPKKAPPKKAQPKKKAQAKKAPPTKRKAKAAPKPKTPAKQPTISNPKVRAHTFLKPMVGDEYFPQHLVQKGQKLLLALAVRIEEQRPAGTGVFALTHATTNAFNDLQEEFFEADSELETGAREAIAADIEFLLKTYGYDVDIEEAIAPRDW